MAKSLPPLGWFRAFESAARHLSFTGAADELGLTQSAISQQIRSLESRLGQRLFIRKHRGIALTDHGRRFLPDVTLAISSLRQVTASFDEPSETTRLIIATSVSVAQWCIAPVLDDFLVDHPDVSVRFVTNVWPEEFDVSSADVIIRFGGEQDGISGSEVLGSERLILAAAPSLVNSKESIHLTQDEVLSYRLIQSVGTSDVWANCAEAFGYDANREAAIQVDSHGLAVDFAQSGAGIALVSELIALRSLNSGHLVRVNPVSIPANDRYTVTVSSKAAPSAAKGFVDWLQKQLDKVA